MLSPWTQVEFKKWAPAFKLLTYYGSAKERKLKRQGWSKPNAFHVAITSYTLILQARLADIWPIRFYCSNTSAPRQVACCRLAGLAVVRQPQRRIVQAALSSVCGTFAFEVTVCQVLMQDAKRFWRKKWKCLILKEAHTFTKL